MLECPHCQYKTSKTFNLSRHISSRHSSKTPQTEDETVCRYCSTKYSNKYNCARHMLSFCKMKPVGQNVDVGGQNVDVGGQNVDVGGQNVDVAQKDSHKCAKCYKTFTTKRRLDDHSTICSEATHPFQCNKCDKILASRYSKSHHVKICKGPEKPQEQAIEAAASTSTVTTGQNSNNIINSTVNTTNNTTNNNVTMNVTINNLGQEKMDHITPDMLTRCLRQLHGVGVANLIESIHFDPNVPENHNIQVDSFKGQTLMVYENNEWKIKDANAVISVLISAGCDILFNHYDNTPQLKHEDHHENHNILYNNLMKINHKIPQVYYPTKRKIMASIRNLEYKKQKALDDGSNSSEDTKQ